MENILLINNSSDFRKWLDEHYNLETECWIKDLKRGEPIDNNFFYYIDAVEVALCYGWIDSVFKKIDGTLYQKFTPRKTKSNWTALNIIRCIRLEELGLMTESGKKLVPTLSKDFDLDIVEDIKNVGLLDEFNKFPLLYKIIRIDNLSSIKRQSKELYDKSFNNFIKYTKLSKTYGSWNDYGRLDNIKL